MISARTAVFGTYAYTFRYRIEVRLVPLDAGPQAYFHQPSRKLELPFYHPSSTWATKRDQRAYTQHSSILRTDDLFNINLLRDFVLRIIIIAPGNKIVDGLHNVLFLPRIELMKRFFFGQTHIFALMLCTSSKKVIATWKRKTPKELCGRAPGRYNLSSQRAGDLAFW